MKITRDKIFLAGVCLIGGITLLFAADINLKDITQTTTVQSSDYVLSVIGTGHVSRLLPLSKLYTNMSNLSSNQFDVETKAQLALAGTEGGGSGWVPYGVIFVDKGGNDTTGERGGKPFLTIAAALAIATAGDVIELGVGTWDVGTSIIDLPHDVSMVGKGPALSKIVTSVVGTVDGGYASITHNALVPGNNSYVSGLTLSQKAPRAAFCGLLGCTANDKAFTGAVLDNVVLDGDTDCIIVGTNVTVGLTVQNSTLKGCWDVINWGAGNSSYCTFENVTIQIDASTAINSHIGAVGTFFNGLGGGKILYNNCKGSMYLPLLNGSPADFYLVSSGNAASLKGFITMKSCYFDFISDVVFDTSTPGAPSYYPNLYWPTPVAFGNNEVFQVIDDTQYFDRLGGCGLGILSKDATNNGVGTVIGNTNMAFFDVTCCWSNICATYFLREHITNAVDISCEGTKNTNKAYIFFKPMFVAP